MTLILQMRTALLILLLLSSFIPVVTGQVRVEMNNNKLYVNGKTLSDKPNKSELDSLIGEISTVHNITSSFNPVTKKTNPLNRQSFHFKSSGLWITYDSEEKKLYAIDLFIKSSNRNPEKDNLITFPNTYKDGLMLLDSTATMDLVLQSINKQAVQHIGTRPYAQRQILSITYKKDDFYIDLMFRADNRQMKQVYIRLVN